MTQGHGAARDSGSPGKIKALSDMLDELTQVEFSNTDFIH
jgi:hypothetical protein